MIRLSTAAQLLDFGARIGTGQRSQEQLEGAVALHHLLAKQGVAYLADEVGMGKTYVALGALALFRHFQPDFRVLILAPRENIQNKWMKEVRNFVAHNVRFPDLRNKAIDNRPARPLVACDNLLDLLHKTQINPNRDFFLRLTSFSLPLAGKDSVDPEAARRLRKGMRHFLPWIKDEVFDLRNRQAFKDNIAKALCCALPKFDLVIVDEGHNLKHGFGEQVSSRNRVLGLAMGHPSVEADPRLFPKYGPRAKRVLFLSATPVEESYKHLWNQLDVFGLSRPFDGLRKEDLDEEAKKAIAKKFLIRRVTAIRIGEKEHTKNLYRREWRRGGVQTHDEPIRVKEPKQRLIVALVQKKVSEILNHTRFNSNFQIGMLASFESFLETAKLKREEGEEANFDDSEQASDVDEREGIDVNDLNKLAKSYRKTFNKEMPHPKMDAMVESLSSAWKSGEKSLIFVRRVASVKEIKKKLDESYDQWLIHRLFRELPHLEKPLKKLFSRYRSENGESESKAQEKKSVRGEDSDLGGNENFFVWFFRGEGPRGVISGANIQQRFIQRGTIYSTFFEDNHVAFILDCPTEEVEIRLAEYLGVAAKSLRAGLRDRSKRFLTQAKKPARADRFEAVQAAGVEWLKEHSGPKQELARMVWHERFESSLRFPHSSEAPDIEQWLTLPTFFTELRKRIDLRARLWPKSVHPDSREAFREEELRAQLLSSAARLGHALIDLYVLAMLRLDSLELRTQESATNEETDTGLSRITDFLNLLETQMGILLKERGWLAFDELSQISENFELILDVNEPEARKTPLVETAVLFGRLLRQQQPIGGMSGQVNQTLVRQFRMPGYPLVLISTDLLQEGEDLHSFCSSISHYGISWTPSSMEQRIGRIDRVRSQTERRLLHVKSGELPGNDMLQVYFPHLEDTIEVLQVQKVLERMNVFLRLMHEGIVGAGEEERTIDASKEFVRGRRVIPQIQDRLKSAFPVTPEHLEGSVNALAVLPGLSEALVARFLKLKKEGRLGFDIEWEQNSPPGELLGTARLEKRVQPFTLLLKSFGESPVVRCISPIGCINPEEEQEAVIESAATVPAHIGAIITGEPRTYDLTVESDVLLAEKEGSDAGRVGLLIRQVAHQADLLEQVHLPGQDGVLSAFRRDMENEVDDGR